MPTAGIIKNRHHTLPKRAKVPTILQMEATECGAASLGMILSYYGLYIPLEQLRAVCGVSRDGSKAINILKAARTFGMIAKGYRLKTEGLTNLTTPLIIHWNFKHFLVLEGFRGNRVFLNDPASGGRTVTLAEFERSFSGIVLAIKPGPDFVRGGRRPNSLRLLSNRLLESKTALTFIFLTGLMLVVPGLMVPAFLRVFIDNLLVGGKVHYLPALILGLAITGILQGCLSFLQQYHLLRLETTLSLTSSAKFFWHVLQLPMGFFTQRYAGDIGSRIFSNDKVATMLSRELASASLSGVMIVFYFVLMLRFDPLLTFVGVCAVCINVTFLTIIARRRANQNMRLLQERGQFTGTSMAGLQIIETLKATGSESDFFARWAGCHARVVASEQEMAESNQFLLTLPNLTTGLVSVVVLILGTYRVLDGHLSMGSLVAFQSLMVRFLQPITDMIRLGSTLQEAEGDIRRLDDVLKHPIEALPSPTYDAGADSLKLSGHLEITNLSFGYSQLEPPLISGFNLTLAPGTRVALVGGSGSGKSTVARLVTGLLQPWSGEIRFDGKQRLEWPRHVLANSLSFVDQDISLFEGTIRDNLTLWDSLVSETDLIRAAKDACIHEDITDKDGGYEAFVQEAGNNFSGGQKQRLEIARALVNNPTTLVMDEATSALDPRTERLIDENIRRRGCTCLIVAHRLSTIRDCDEIIVLKDGQIIERGTHENLAAKGGEYSRLIGVPKLSVGGEGQ